MVKQKKESIFLGKRTSTSILNKIGAILFYFKLSYGTEKKKNIFEQK